MPAKSHLLILSKYTLVAWLFSPQKSHLLVLWICWLGRKIAYAGDYTYIHTTKHRKTYRLTYSDWYLMQNEVYWIPTIIFFGILNFGIGIHISRFFNSGIRKKKSTGIFGIENGIGILLPMGIPEIGTENRNSQPSQQPPPWWDSIPENPFSQCFLLAE